MEFSLEIVNLDFLERRQTHRRPDHSNTDRQYLFDFGEDGVEDNRQSDDLA